MNTDPDSLDRMIRRAERHSRHKLDLAHAIAVGKDGIVVKLDEAMRAQLKWLADREGVTIEQLAAAFILHKLRFDEIDLDYNGALMRYGNPEGDALHRRKHRLVMKFIDKQITFNQFRANADKIDGGTWAIPLYTMHSETDRPTPVDTDEG
jgi:hypothetical protein